MSKKNVISPGARVEIRDAEWVVRRVEQSSHAGRIVYAVGLSGLVKDKEGIFLERFEDDDIVPLDPRQTTLVPDQSARGVDALLYLDAQLRQATPTDDRVHVAHQAAMDTLDYQLDPTRKAVSENRTRLLIADDVGLGKTLEAGALTAELAYREKARRILVVAPKSMLTQFQKEFWTRFSIPLTRLDSTGIERVRERIPAGHNPFHFFDRVIISVDTLKNDVQYRTAVETAWWDLVIIDEAHNVAERRSAGGRSQRNRLAERLARRTDGLVLLSATPHDGTKRSFASLIQMLDPTAIVDPENYDAKDVQGYFLRRFRFSEDVKQALRDAIPPRETLARKATTTQAEDNALSALADLNLNMDRRRRSGSRLFKTLLEKAAFSSPAALLETVDQRLRSLDRKDDSDPADTDQLRKLRDATADIDTAKNTGKYLALLDLIRELGWTGRDDDRLVIFTERIATMRMLVDNLPGDLGVATKAVASMHGGMHDEDLQQVVEDFGRRGSPVRLLVATDVAAEGIDLHHASNKLIHYDLPWSLLKFQQRNGRIDRYGQTAQPHVYYLMLRSGVERINGDHRILEVLMEKDRRARESIADPSAFMGTNIEEEQEDVTASAIEQGKDHETFDRDLEFGAGDTANNAVSFMEELLAESQEQLSPPGARRETVAGRERLYPDSGTFAEAVLRRLRHDGEALQFDAGSGYLDMAVPDELREPGDFGTGHGRRIDTRWMPREAVPKNGTIRLTSDPAAINDAIKKARTAGEGWPSVQYLWDVHPLMSWFCDKATARVCGRHQAPILKVARDILKPGETVFVMNSVVPNKQGQPLLDAWPCVAFDGNTVLATEGVTEFLSRVGWFESMDVNTGDVDANRASSLLDEAVDAATAYVRGLRDDKQAQLDRHLETDLQRIEALKQESHADIERRYDPEKGIRAAREAQLGREKSRIERIFDERWRWIWSTKQMDTSVDPHIRVIAVFQG